LEKVWITNICDGAKNVVVDSITARDTQDSPISVGTGATEGTYKTQDIIIQNCNMSLRKQAEGSGIDFYGDVMNFRVVGNSINGSASDGIHAIIDGGPYSAPRFGLISGNRVCGTRAGFGIATSGTSAVYPHDIIITENIVTGGFSGGIAVQSGRNYTVTNNICYANHGRGIYVAADGANLYNAILEGNTCYDVGGVQNYGIHLMKSGAGLGQVVVLGNNLIGNVDANYIAVGSPTNVTNEHNLGYP
jgi:parallel beta-helix repeat protein